MGGLVRLVVRLAPLGILGAWLLERRLRGRAGDAGPEPIRTSIVIDAPIERVWAILADIERQPEWMHDLKSVDVLTPGPIGVGTRARGMVRAFGVPVEDVVEITVFEPPNRYAIRHDGLVKGSGDIRLAAGADGRSTTVTWDEVLVPPALPHLGARVIAAVFEPIFRRDLERLAAVAESDLEPSA